MGEEETTEINEMAIKCPVCAVEGFATSIMKEIEIPHFGKVLETTIQCKKCGFKHSDVIALEHNDPAKYSLKISEETLSFEPQTNYHRWKATVFHLDNSLDKLADDFIKSNDELALFQIVGHTYDLDTENMWDKIENIFKKVSNQNDVIPMTTIEIIEYLTAMDKVEITDSHIINNSNKSLWFLINGAVRVVNPESKLAFA